MRQPAEEICSKSRLGALLEHFATIGDPPDVRRILHPLSEILLLVVCATIADCDDYDAITAWGEAHLGVLRRHLPCANGVPGGRWLTILINRISPALFQAAFAAWVRESWPDRPEFVAIDGKTSRRSHDRAAGEAPLHLVSTFATTSRLVLGREAVAGKSSELTATPTLLARLAGNDGPRGALVSIDAIATNGTIARAIRDAGADYLLALKANQPGLRADIKAAFRDAPAGSVRTHVEHDKGHGRIERRGIAVIRESGWPVRRPPLPRRVAPAGRRQPRSRRGTRSTRARPACRNPVPHLTRRARRHPRGGGRSRPLGHREQSSLGARCHLRRGPVAPKERPRRPQHGRRQALRDQPRPLGGRREVHQAATQDGRLGHRLSVADTRCAGRVTRIHGPAAPGQGNRLKDSPLSSRPQVVFQETFSRERFPCPRRRVLISRHTRAIA